VIAGYLSHVDPVQHGGATVIPDGVPRGGIGTAKFKSVRLLEGDAGRPTGSLLLNQSLVLEAALQVHESIEEAILEVGITTVDEQRVITALNSDGGRPLPRLDPGLHHIRVELDSDLLPGEFVIDLGVHERVTGATVDMVERVLQFDVGVSDGEGETYAIAVRGYLRATTRWELERADAAARTAL
jgi:hypothetical protein